MLDYLIGDERLIQGLFIKFDLESNTALRKKVMDYINLHTSPVGIISAETMLYGASDAKALGNIVSGGTLLKYLFRGASQEFAGGGNALANVTSTSTNPAISTVFALHKEALSPGAGFLYFIDIEELSKNKIAFPNTLAEQESEIALEISPANFLNLPGIKKISAEKARVILKQLGIDLPPSANLQTSEKVREVIKDLPFVSPNQIKTFHAKLH
jgi:hypothetical protein